MTVQNTITSKGDLLVQGNVDFINNLTVENDITSKGDLLVQGNIDCNSNLTVQSDTIIKRNLTVEGTTFFTSTPNFTTDLNVEGSLYVNEDIESNNSNIKGNLIVNGSLDLGNKENNNSTINLSGATNLFIKSDEHKNYNISQFHIKTSDSNYNGISFGINSEKYCYLQSYKYNQSSSVHSIQPLLLNPNGGNVGISKNNPEYTLDVNGDSNFSNNMYTKTIYSSNDGTSHLSFTAENGNCFIKSFSNDINGSTWSPLHFTNGFSSSSPPKYYMSIVPNSNGNSANIGINKSNPVLPLDVNGDTKITGNLDVTGIATLSNTLNVSSNGIKFSDNIVQTTAFIGGSVPIGGIIMWNGTNAPTGWGLCDGSSYGNDPNKILSPDLRGRFILSYSSDYNIGQKQGSAQVTLGVNEIPAHTHIATVNDLGHTHSITDKQHSHSITDPEHSHAIDDQKHSHTYQATFQETGYNGDGNSEAATQDLSDGTTNLSSSNITVLKSSTGITGTNSSFTGIIGTNIASTGITVSNSSVGGGHPHENMPPYYVLAYIIRIS